MNAAKLRMGIAGCGGIARLGTARVLPAMVLILAVNAAGEAAGSLFGVGDSDTGYSGFEIRRYRHVRAGDKSLWQ